jgi:hypothetical protein
MVTAVTLSFGLLSAGLSFLGLSAALVPHLAARYPSLYEYGRLYMVSAAILLIPLRGQLAEGFGVFWSGYGPVASGVAMRAEPQLVMPFLEASEERQIILTISSDPSGARLYLAGRYFGRTPSWLLVPAGEALAYTVVAPDATVRSYSGWHVAWQDTPLHIWLDRYAP